MTWVDWVIVLALALSVAFAAKEGFFYEVFSLAGVVVGYVLAAWEYTRVAAWLSPFTKTQWLAEVAGFLLIFVAVAMLAGI
ncbi:MAG TPA: CvpA family protein, partial [Terriglobales bacterium]|nr:CvpA family protein [Terriglobales bacterium]